MRLKKVCNYFVTMFFLVFFIAVLYAEVPHQINYQGRLLDSGGNPVNSATEMTFSFYDSETGGSQIGSFSEARTGNDAVPVSNGIFNVLIGSRTDGGIPASIFSGTTVYVNVYVGGDNLTPRPRVVSVGYAYQADKLSGRDYTTFVDTHTVQTITGAKTFTPTTIFSSATISGQISLKDGIAISSSPFANITSDTGIDNPCRLSTGTLVMKSGDQMTGQLNMNISPQPLSISTTNGYLNIGQYLFGANQLGVINFGYGITQSPAYIGYVCTVANNYGKGDLIFGTRDVETSPGMPTEKMRIDSSGNVKIGTLAGAGNRAVYSDSNGNLTNTASDKRLKKNILSISDQINIIDSLKKLRGVYYNWDVSIPTVKNLGNQKEIGMVAQEVEQVLPELVGQNNTGYKTIDYAKMSAFLIEVAKEQQKKIEELENRLKALEEK